jgi:tetratricopeptide (TPR) repeat protein
MYFLGVMWHVPEQAAAFKKQVDPVFSQLTLYPIVQRYFSKYTNSPIQKTPPRYIESIGDTETISAANWYFLTETSGAFSAWRVSWTPTEMPFGTAYDIEHRVDGRSTYYDIKRPEWDALESEAPYNYSVLYFYIRIKYGPKPTLQQFEEGYQSILSYHISAMEDVADSLKNDPKAYTDMMNRMCNLLPDKYFDFGDYFVEHNWDEQAAQAYQRGVDLAKNRVLMANSCQWLVNYYFDTGRKDDALIIAKEAADVYSGRGLATMASLMEKMGKWGDAETYYKKIKERYDDGSELNEFYIRNRARNENYNAVYKREKDQFFPGGFEKIRLADLSSPPVDGVAVKSETYLTQKYHVGVGAVFVGIDGYRVHSIQQYSFLRATTGDPNITLIVWSNGKYTEVKATLPNRKFECEIDNYSIRR